MTSSKNIDEAYSPLRVVNQLVALRMFQLPRGRVRPVISLVYLLVLNSLSIAATYYRAYRITNVTSPLENLLYTFHSYVNIFTIVYNSFIGYYHTKTMIEFQRRLRNLNATFSRLGVPAARYKTTFYITIIGGMIFIIQQTLVISSFLYWLSNWMSVAYACIIAWPHLHGEGISSVITIDYIVNARFLRDGYHQVNEILRDLLRVARKTRKSSSALNSDYSIITYRVPIMKMIPNGSHNDDEKDCQWKINRTLQTIKQVHLELIQTGKIFSSVFSAQILMEMGILIMNSVGILYSVYNRFLQYDLISNTDRLVEVFISILICFNYTVKVFFVNHVCEQIYREEKKTEEILYSLSGTNIGLEAQLEIRQFSLQIAKCTFKCCPGGFFALGHSFIGGFMGSVTTYLVILIQMSSVLNKQIGNTTDNETGKIAVPDMPFISVASDSMGDFFFSQNDTDKSVFP